MSMHSLHKIRDYRSQDWILGVPTLARVITISHFEAITKYLHLNDNSKMPARRELGFDKLFKLRPFLESIHANFLLQYMPHKKVAVDEAMIKFKGRIIHVDPTMTIFFYQMIEICCNYWFVYKTFEGVSTIHKSFMHLGESTLSDEVQQCVEFRHHDVHTLHA